MEWGVGCVARVEGCGARGERCGARGENEERKAWSGGRAKDPVQKKALTGAAIHWRSGLSLFEGSMLQKAE